MNDRPLISSAPQIHAAGSTAQAMAWVLIALTPAVVWSVVLFGGRPILIIALGAAAAMGTEGLLNLTFGGRKTLGDLSAMLTGVLVGLNMPPSVPLYIPVVASVFAVAVVKWSFGGLGANWMNPAMAGRVFVFFSWGEAMSRWTLPRIGGGKGAGGLLTGVDSLSGATPLSTVKVMLTDLPAGVDGPMRILESAGMPITYWDLFIGRMPGSIGEVSTLLLLAGGLLLIGLKVVQYEVPLAYLGSFALLMWTFDGVQYGNQLFSGDVLFHLLTGSLMLGALFMATDWVTTPLTRKGRVIFGLGCGLITFVVRRFGSLPEGVSLAVIFMNILTPLIDRWTKPRRYGRDV